MTENFKYFRFTLFKNFVGNILSSLRDFNNLNFLIPYISLKNKFTKKGFIMAGLN